MIDDHIKELAKQHGFIGAEENLLRFGNALLLDSLGEAKQTTAERAAFYEAQMVNPNTHSALAFELAFLRAKLDKQNEAAQDGATLDWLGSVLPTGEVGISFLDGMYTVVYDKQSHDTKFFHEESLREALLEAMRHADE